MTNVVTDSTHMTVKTLIEMLQDLNPNMAVYVNDIDGERGEIKAPSFNFIDGFVIVE